MFNSVFLSWQSQSLQDVQGKSRGSPVFILMKKLQLEDTQQAAAPCLLQPGEGAGPVQGEMERICTGATPVSWLPGRSFKKGPLCVGLMVEPGKTVSICRGKLRPLLASM